jgi:hypothetical protein
LCKQEAQAELVGALETLTAAKLNLEYELVRSQKELVLVHKQLEKKEQMSDLQVSHSSLNSTEIRIFGLHCTFLKEREKHVRCGITHTH